VRLRIALIILALVVAPAVVFTVAKNHSAPAPVVGWTAYAPSDVTPSSPGTSYVIAVPEGGPEMTTVEVVALKPAVAKWLGQHPDGSCQVKPPHTAYCKATSTTDSLTVLQVSQPMQ
jgi:hypothetical protein